MAIITLLTDSGDSDHYVAAIKAKILNFKAGVNIIDISHKITAFDIAHGAFLLKSVFRDFPSGTVHLVGVNATGNHNNSFIALALEGHFFVGANNGLFGLISTQPHQNVVELNVINPIESTFPEKDILAPAATKLATGISITNLGKPMTSFKKMTNRHVKKTYKEILGCVMHIDSYGNLITNILKTDFDHLSKDKKISLLLRGERFQHIQTKYSQVEEGDCFLIFNSQSLLEIGINKGRANELLGLEYDSPVHIKFES